jgi:hypothetical protein
MSWASDHLKSEGELSMAEVDVSDSRIVVRHLVLEDKDAAMVLSELDPERRSETVLIALRLGFLMYRHAQTGVNVDFVRREFEHVASEIKAHWETQVKSKISELVADYFNPQTGVLPRKLAEYFGDASHTGKLAELFSEKNTESLTYQLRQIIQKELTGENSAFIKALDPDDERTPIGRLKKKIEEPIDELRKDLLREETAAAVAETGTQKGGPYEDLTYSYIERIAAAFGDTAEDVSDQNAPGDYISTLDAETIPGQILKIAIDAKDKKMGLKECETTLADSKARWGAHSALLVFARQDETPFDSPIALRKLTEGYVCVFEKQSLDPVVLQATYQIVRLDAVRSARRSGIEIDAAQVQQKLEEALRKLQEFSTLKRRLSEAIKDLRAIREFASSLCDDLQQRLQDAWTALGIKAPVPVLLEEPNTSE